ncbi:MAG: phosphate--AMP phosphotransferase, partial [Firmicutes bacterium]|nr:phosphate--AMP phosphotransferase [Bacillota bacterium]
MLKEFIRPDDGMDKESRKAETKRLKKLVTALQPDLREAKIPVVVLVEGWAAAGKGSLINDLISDIDPRFSSVFQYDSALRGAERYPFLYPFFAALPENGKVLFMDGGWMERAVQDKLTGDKDEDAWKREILSVQRFERQLRDNGYLVLKLFVNVSKEEQASRQKKLLSKKYTAWRVSKYDLKQNEHYKKYQKAYDEFMEATGEVFPWHVVSGEDKKVLRYDAFKLLADTISAGIASGKYVGAPFEEDFPLDNAPMLSDADLSLSLTEEEYKEQLDELQNKIKMLHNRIYRKRIPMVICYEGWDAAGKGGNIRRLAYPLDPRGFDTYPIASPEPREKNRHYLWRF